MPTKSGGEQGFLVTLRGEVFSKILAKAYLGQKKDSSKLSCPVCVSEAEPTVKAMGLTQFICPDCSFEFLAKQSENQNAKT